MTPINKECRICGALKPVGDFYERRRVCKPCLVAQRREWIRAHPQEHTSRSRAWQKANPDKMLNMKLKRVYGITLEDFQNMLRQQGGVCAICQQECDKRPRLSVDHCHKTGRVRGLLCHGCNTALGYMRDDPERLHRAITYLKPQEDSE